MYRLSHATYSLVPCLENNLVERPTEARSKGSKLLISISVLGFGERARVRDSCAQGEPVKKPRASRGHLIAGGSTIRSLDKNDFYPAVDHGRRSDGLSHGVGRQPQWKSCRCARYLSTVLGLGRKRRDPCSLPQAESPGAQVGG